jgi:hypothetical protein
MVTENETVPRARKRLSIQIRINMLHNEDQFQYYSAVYT